MKPVFSIIIPTYNRGLTLGRAIDSVLSQTFKDWELIVIDDGSTDNTENIVMSYKDKRIRYIWQENQERSAARNHGIEIANGDWICFLDSDDALMSHHLQSFQTGMFDFPGYDMYRTGFVIMDHEKVVNHSNLGFITEFHNTYPNDYIFIYAFNRQVFNHERFDERFNYLEDMHFLLRTTPRFSYFQLAVHTYKYYYDPHSTGSLSSKFKSIILNKNLCIDDMLKFQLNPHQKILKWIYVVDMILYLRGSLVYDVTEIVNGLYLNLKAFIRYPLIYIRVVLRIVFVKISEGIFNTKFKFRF